MTTEPTKPTRQRRWPRGTVKEISFSLVTGTPHVITCPYLAKSIAHCLWQAGVRFSKRRIKWNDVNSGYKITINP